MEAVNKDGAVELAEYLIEELGPSLEMDGRPFTSEDVIYAGLTIKALVWRLIELEKSIG